MVFPVGPPPNVRPTEQPVDINQCLKQFNNTYDQLVLNLGYFHSLLAEYGSNYSIDSAAIEGVRRLIKTMGTLGSSLKQQYEILSRSTLRNASTWQKEIDGPYRKMTVDLENSRILTQEEVQVALEEQQKRAASAYAQNGMFGQIFRRYQNFSYVNSEQLPPSNFFLESSLVSAGKCSVGISGAQGDRNSMEDTNLVTEIVVKTPSGKMRSIPLFGVFDGHGGAAASLHVRMHLASQLKNKLEFFLQLQNSEVLSEDVVYNALKFALVELHREFGCVNGRYTSDAGTTVNVSLIVDHHLYTANIGDSRSIFVYGDSEEEAESCCSWLSCCLGGESRGVQLSEDAKPNDPRHKKIIEDLGGTVTWTLDDGIYRISDDIATGSSLGDHLVKGSNPTVDITKTLMHKEGGWCLIASDGLWDVVTSKQMVKVLSGLMKSEGSLEDIAKNLVYSAYKAANKLLENSSDNITALLVNIPPRSEEDLFLKPSSIPAGIRV